METILVTMMIISVVGGITSFFPTKASEKRNNINSKVLTASLFTAAVATVIGILCT